MHSEYRKSVQLCVQQMLLTQRSNRFVLIVKNEIHVRNHQKSKVLSVLSWDQVNIFLCPSCVNAESPHFHSRCKTKEKISSLASNVISQLCHPCYKESFSHAIGLVFRRTFRFSPGIQIFWVCKLHFSQLIAEHSVCNTLLNYDGGIVTRSL